jgi:hypothetical protein
MEENVKQIIRDMQEGNLWGAQLEEKEISVLGELCGTNEKADLAIIFKTLGASGTILSIPALCAHLKVEDQQIRAMAGMSVRTIRERAKERGSLLPDEYFTPEHWQPEWQGSKNAFLSYVQAIADAYIKMGNEESELDRIGGILAEEMGMEIVPYQTFADFRLCQTSWDYKADYQVLLDRMKEEKIFMDLEDAGITESDISYISDSLMDLQYDYLIGRLKLKGDIEYYRFIFKMAECLNEPEP